MARELYQLEKNLADDDHDRINEWTEVEVEAKKAQFKFQISEARSDLEHLLSHRVQLICPALHEFGDICVNPNFTKTKNHVGDYRVTGGTLGKGAYATLRLCQRQTGSKWEKFAIKMFEKSQIKSLAELESMNQEIRILRQHGNHPNITTLHEAIQSPHHVSLILERFEVGVQTLMKDQSVRSEQRDFPKQVMMGVLKAVEYLHASGVCHLELKPESCIWCPRAKPCSKLVLSSEIRVCDFGLRLLSKTARFVLITKMAI